MTLAGEELTDRIARIDHEIRLLLPDDVVRLIDQDERVKAAIKLTELTGVDFTQAQRIVSRL